MTIVMSVLFPAPVFVSLCLYTWLDSYLFVRQMKPGLAIYFREVLYFLAAQCLTSMMHSGRNLETAEARLAL